MSKHKAGWNIPGLVLPFALCAVGLFLWWRFGFDRLDEMELPLAAWINGLSGRSVATDWLIVFFNDFWGEALTVVIAFASFCLLARWVTGPRIDWRPVGVYAAYILVFWLITNGISDEFLEDLFDRDSPSHLLGDDLINIEEKRGWEVKTSSSTSFPSNHGNVFFSLFFMCFLRWGRKAWVLFPLCFVLSIPRCFTGAHWVTDTLIGSVLVSWAIAAVAVHTPLYRITQKLEAISLTIPKKARVGAAPP